MLGLLSELEPERPFYGHTDTDHVQPKDEQIFTHKRSQAEA
jgi:hypothetical protein